MFNANISKSGRFLSEFFNANAGESRRKWPCPYGVCSRALGYIVILNVLLHTSQVYEYVHLTEVTVLLWLMIFLLLPTLARFILFLVFVQTFVVCVPAKVQLPILGN